MNRRREAAHHHGPRLFPFIMIAGGLYIMVRVLCHVSGFFYLFFLCPSRPRQHFPSSPASSAAGYGCGRKTLWPSSLAGCSPAEGRVRGSARSQPLQGLAAPWGFSLGESPLLHALPPTRDASARRASLWGADESVNKWKCVGSELYGCGREMVTWFWWNTSPLMNIGYRWADWSRSGCSPLPWRSSWSFLLHHHFSLLLNFLLFFLDLRIFWKGVCWVARHYCRAEITQKAINQG